MDRRKPLDALDFDHHFIFDDEIDSMIGDELAAIEERDAHLLFESNPTGRELDAECSFVRRLEQARAKTAMNFQRTAKNTFGRFDIAVHHNAPRPRVSAVRPP